MLNQTNIQDNAFAVLNIESEDESQKKQYLLRVQTGSRTIVKMFLRALQVKHGDAGRNLAADLLNSKARKYHLSEKMLTTDRLRQRIYHSERFKKFPFWVAASAYHCLLDLMESGDWKPQTYTERFLMMALYIRRSKPRDYDSLLEALPPFFKDERGVLQLKQHLEILAE